MSVYKSLSSQQVKVGKRKRILPDLKKNYLSPAKNVSLMSVSQTVIHETPFHMVPCSIKFGKCSLLNPPLGDAHCILAL